MKIPLLLLFICITNFTFAQASPFPQNPVYQYVAGTLPTTVTSADAKDAYDIWKTNQVETCPSNGWIRVKYDDPSVTVSEGIGYGMLLSAYYGDKTSFDGMWKYYIDHADPNGLMDWKIQGCSSTRLGSYAATDAELDVATALLIASKQWPTASPYNYLTDAISLIKKIKQYETTVNSSGLHILKPGDAFGGETCSNASYYAPAYYRLFAQCIPADATFWNNMARDAYVSMQLNANSTTGLVSDWQNFVTGVADDAGCGTTFNAQGKNYIYDACRTPWRFMLDYLWWGKTDGLAVLQKNTNFINTLNGVGISAVKDGFTQNGTITGQYHNAPFVGGFAVGAMSSNQTIINNFATDFKNINPTYEPYFGKSLRALYMLTLTGNFWLPNHVSKATICSQEVTVTKKTSN